MKRITETLSKEVVAAAEGKILGIVTNAYADRRLSRVRGYKVASEDRDADRILPLRRLLGDGDAMIVRESGVLSETTLADCPMGAKVFDTLGAFHGVLRDLMFDERTGEVLSLVADEKEISPDRIVGYGANAVILRAPCHDGISIRRRGAKGGKRKATASSKRQPSATAVLTVTELPSLPETESEGEVFSGEYAFLLGRTVLKTIVAEGEPIARESEVVTHELIAKAREKDVME